MIEAVGALHIHSHCSDGSGTVSEIVQAASDAGLDFLAITDHNTLCARRDGWEGWHGNVLVAVGAEISPKRGGHVLALNVHSVEGLVDLPEREFVSRIRKQNGYAFVAHPGGSRNLRVGVMLREWQEWHLEDFQGIEIWSFMHDWVDAFKWLRVFEFHRDPYSKVSGPSPVVLEIWDRLLKERKVVAICGIDAHAKNLLTRKWQFLPYKMTFNTTLLHVFVPEWSGDETLDLPRLYEAIVEGRSFVAYDYEHSARGFSFTAEADGKVYQMGQEVFPQQGSCVLSVSVPDAAKLTLKKDGLILEQAQAETLQTVVSEKGVYRVEVFRNGRPWIFSNPIFVRTAPPLG